MLNIQVFPVNMIHENCYIVSDESNEAVIIDCGAFFREDKECIREYVEEKSLEIKHLICTHGHFDHILGNEFVYETYGLKPELHAADAMLYNHCGEQIAQFLGEKLNITLPILGEFVDENSVIKFGSHEFTVIPTPGHTPGGVSYYCKEENVLFCGDSLFRRSIGRTDFPYGDEQLLIRKLQENILPLPDCTKVFPGHGTSTTIGEEKTENPFFTTML